MLLLQSASSPVRFRILGSCCFEVAKVEDGLNGCAMPTDIGTFVVVIHTKLHRYTAEFTLSTVRMQVRDVAGRSGSVEGRMAFTSVEKRDRTGERPEGIDCIGMCAGFLRFLLLWRLLSSAKTPPSKQVVLFEL